MNTISQIKPNAGRVLIENLNMASSKVFINNQEIRFIKSMMNELAKIRTELSECEKKIAETNDFIRTETVHAMTRKHHLNTHRWKKPITELKESIEIKQILKNISKQKSVLAELEIERDTMAFVIQDLETQLKEPANNLELIQNRFIDAVGNYNRLVGKLNEMTSSSHPLLETDTKNCKPKRFNYLDDYATPMQQLQEEIEQQ